MRRRMTLQVGHYLRYAVWSFVYFASNRHMALQYVFKIYVYNIYIHISLLGSYYISYIYICIYVPIIRGQAMSKRPSPQI